MTAVRWIAGLLVFGRGLAFFGMWGSLGMECGGAEDAEGLHFVSMPGEDLLELALAVGKLVVMTGSRKKVLVGDCPRLGGEYGREER